MLPLLRRAPRHLDHLDHLDHLATIIERGEARAQLSLFSDEHDVRVVTNLVNRAVLAMLGGVVGLMSVALLALLGGHRSPHPPRSSTYSATWGSSSPPCSSSERW
jgi:hypothetical protein